MIELQKLSTKFEADNPDIKLNWVVVEENILRQRVTTDVSTGSGQCDLVFIGLYETPIFAKRGWAERDRELPCRLQYPFRPSSPSATSASNSRHRTATHTAFPRKTDRHESI
jgi:hypothetical protein